MRIVVTGATGTIGRRLIESFGEAEVTVLSRDVAAAKRTVPATHHVAWDGRSSIAPSVFEGADVVYHLAGEPVASGRWTADKRRRIVESRKLGTRAVVDALEGARSGAALVSASAVGFYGSRGDELLIEESAPGQGFLSDVCRTWEDEAARAERFGARVAMLRIGIVLAREGGALAKMLPIFRTGLAGRLGAGAQWMPWIHVDDVVGLLWCAGATTKLAGPINAVSPRPVTNAEFTRSLARAVHRPAFFHAPSFALHLALGELADVVLASQRVLPAKALAAGYAFRQPSLDVALADLIGGSPLEREVAA